VHLLDPERHLGSKGPPSSCWFQSTKMGEVSMARHRSRGREGQVRSGLSAGGRWIRTSGSARDRSWRAAVQKTLGVARQSLRTSAACNRISGPALDYRSAIQASDDQAANGRLDVAAIRIIRPPGRPWRVSPPARRRGRGSLRRSSSSALPDRAVPTHVGRAPYWPWICPSRRLSKATIFC
jgi:hypothetical protein